MTKKYLLTILVILIIISGCNLLERKQQPIVASEIFKGTKGLTMEFIKNAPPADVFETTEFNAIIRLRNQGAYDIGFEEGGEKKEGNREGDNRGILVITPETGYFDIVHIDISDRVELKGKEDKNQGVYFKLRGRSVYDNVGEEEMIYTKLIAKSLGSLSEVHPSIIFATVCYPYQTKLSTSICIDPDIYNLKPGKKACQVKDLSFADGQGGPVAIVKVEMEMIAEGDIVKPRFFIYLENKGSGEIVREHEGACNPQINKPEEQEKYFNLIKITGSISGKEGEIKINCIPKEEGQKTGEEKQGFVRLRGEKDVVRCECLEGKSIPKDVDAYITPLNINLDYGYIETISKSFNIKKP